MEAALASAGNLIQDGISLVKSFTNSNPVKATFTRLNAPSIPRSSHTVSVVNGRVYIFGGEITPRQPVDNAMHVVTIPANKTVSADYNTIDARPSKSNGEVPQARVGHSAAVIGQCIYIFGGRGGVEMTALSENGRVWVFDTTTETWSHLDPIAQAPYPEPRSYHTSTASEYPLPQSAPNIANVLLEEQPKSIRDFQSPAPSSYGTLFIHAGCLAKGRTSDLWSFDLSSQSWAQFPSAPYPPRGGTSLVMVRNRLYRYGGFDGNTEQGGAVDFLDVNIADAYDDEGGQGTIALSPRGSWRSISFAPESNRDESGVNRTVPSNRSVLGLAPVTIGHGREYLLMVCGEGEASKLGHAGAGRFFDDVWTFQLRPVGNTAASYKDATTQYIMGMETEEGSCVEVKYHDAEGGMDGNMVQESQEKPMGRRGWLACSPCEVGGVGSSVLVWGGINEENERLGDGWIITVE